MDNILTDILAAEILEGALDDQRARVTAIVDNVRPMVIVDEHRALRGLLGVFAEDTGKAATVAAFAVIELAKQNDRLAEFARWLISMDAMDIEAGWTLRKAVSLNDILERAREALGRDVTA